MHFRVSLSSAALFVALLTLLAIPSFALPISGDLHIAGLGDAQVASTFLNFLCQTIGNPTSPCPAGYGNFQATSGTQSFAPYSGDVGFIHSLNNAGQPINQSFSLLNFLIFDPVPGFGTVLPPDIALDLSFIFTGTQGQGQCAIAPAPGQNCTPALASLVTPANPGGLSPFNLQNTQTGSTASFSVLGTARRISTNEQSNFIGVFSADFTVPYQSYLPTIATGGIVTSPYSATFTANIVPEPGTMTIMAGGLLLIIGSISLRRRRQRA